MWKKKKKSRKWQLMTKTAKIIGKQRYIWFQETVLTNFGRESKLSGFLLCLSWNPSRTMETRKRSVRNIKNSCNNKTGQKYSFIWIYQFWCTFSGFGRNSKYCGLTTSQGTLGMPSHKKICFSFDCFQRGEGGGGGWVLSESKLFKVLFSVHA